MKLAWANTSKFTSAYWVIAGVPDESGSHASRKGASKGPDRLRKVTHERSVVKRGKHVTVFQPQTCSIHSGIMDYGNVKKDQVTALTKKIVAAGKVPVFVGGDHSITYNVLKGFESQKKKLSLVYFDAHPDFVPSTQEKYYGSVVYDLFGMRHILPKKSFQIGNRALEADEIANIKKSGMQTITPADIAEQGVKKAFQKIKKTVGKNVYLSIDLDVVDPAFAPGVDTPIPGGLSSNELLYLVSKIASLNLVGFDIMELSPPNDIQDMTSDLASKLMIEIISCARHGN